MLKLLVVFRVIYIDDIKFAESIDACPNLIGPTEHKSGFEWGQSVGEIQDFYVKPEGGCMRISICFYFIIYVTESHCPHSRTALHICSY